MSLRAYELMSESMTNFDLNVYKVVSKIPLGEVRTYKWVAKQIGRPKAYRAVGNALNKNPFPLIIPCHRVIKTGGSLGGFARGKREKKRLLDLERQIKKLMV